MYKVYYNQEKIASDLYTFFEKFNLRKTQLNILPDIIYGMLVSKSCVASSIARVLKGKFSLLQHDSNTTRIRRFFNNVLFDSYLFYDYFIKHVISTYKKKHSDKRVHITFDHMFSHDNYTVFMISMRVGTQSIPIWFRCFKGVNVTPISNPWEENMIIDGIYYVSSLFPKDLNLIFLADRWFNSRNIMNTIDSLGHTYCLRLKNNIKVLTYNKKEKHNIWIFLKDIKGYNDKSKIFKDITIFNTEYKSNIVISKSKNVKEPWIIITNGEPKRAIKDYGYRFGSIESLFKNQKSNGFKLETVNNATLKSFTTMYTLVCFCCTWMIILGAEYSKNSSCYKNFNLNTHKNYNGIKKRVKSLFKTGLDLFSLAINSSKYVRLPMTFILYDI